MPENSENAHGKLPEEDANRLLIILDKQEHNNI